ncbi:transposase [Ruthenibacterium lactatiformans]|uniref:transposase n=1 Tax=Ruthenibacterium lactatiformans TaxID=1550024 RepID=UPI0035211DA6
MIRQDILRFFLFFLHFYCPRNREGHTEQGRPSREVAAELGICIDTLRSWLKAAGAPSPGQADRQNRDARRLRELEAEIRALRKKLEEKDGVIDILKKSVGILSKP